ncbi:YdcF family protein [Aquabacterium sp.]|uniref:YdcF family protein n=1 Tax=Aquabacterium sp. TaxID=1872578 RepID=UPI002BC2FEEC|nr:YdcF family protein [Aquabacterium sp.]HSW07947.1 YdcF family protein [Aquabacterium sp.]
MNQLFVTLGIEAWKPWLSALVMPPIPLLLLVLLGARLLPRRRALGWTCVSAGLIGLWAMCTTGLGYLLMEQLTQPPPALSAAQLNDLAKPGLGPRTAILVLGAGRRAQAPEFAAADLSPLTLERVRYGAWLAKRTGLPLGYSGGIGHGSAPGPSEAEVVHRVAERDFGVRLRWAEGRSRDTNENALNSVPLLQKDGIERIVLVTHDFHQRRALAAFGRAAQRQGAGISLLPAPLGVPADGRLQPADLMPTPHGFMMVWLALHEWLGWLAGA